LDPFFLPFSSGILSFILSLVITTIICIHRILYIYDSEHFLCPRHCPIFISDSFGSQILHSNMKSCTSPFLIVSYSLCNHIDTSQIFYFKVYSLLQSPALGSQMSSSWVLGSTLCFGKNLPQVQVKLNRPGGYGVHFKYIYIYIYIKCSTGQLLKTKITIIKIFPICFPNTLYLKYFKHNYLTLKHGNSL
jgi:hypothetical protein